MILVLTIINALFMELSPREGQDEVVHTEHPNLGMNLQRPPRGRGGPPASPALLLPPERQRCRTPAATRALTALLSVAALPVGSADVTIAQYGDLGDFSYAVEYMPDIDQRRAGLLNDGSAHCGPASVMNLFGYAANFGFPDLAPGPGIWAGGARHLEMSLRVFTLGNLMGTDETGTNFGGMNAGVDDWLAAYSGEGMSFLTLLPVGGYWPLVDHGALLASMGGVVGFCFGRFDFVPGLAGMPRLTARPQGHCVTLQRAVANTGDGGGPREIRYRNPGSPDDGNLFSNSDYASVDLPTATNMAIERDLDGDGQFTTYTMTSMMNPPPADNRYRVIDGLFALYPPGGMSFTEVDVAAQFSNNQLGFVSSQQPEPFAVPADTRVLSAVPHPELHSGLVLLEQRGVGKFLAQVRHAGGGATFDPGLPDSARHLVLGYGHSVFVVGDDGVLHFEAWGEALQRVGAAAWPREMTGVAIEAAAYNQELHELLLVSGAHHRLFIVEPATLRLKATYRLVPRTPLGRVRSMTAWGQPRGQVMAALDDRRLIQIEYLPGRPSVPGPLPAQVALAAPVALVVLPGVQDPLSLDIGTGGRLYVADRRTGLREFTRQPGRGWQAAAKPLYAGFALAGRQFAVFKSRTTFRPGLHDTPEWNNIPAEELIPLGPEIPDATSPR